MLKYLFNKFSGLQAANFITKRLQHRYFPVNIATFLKTSILKDICERLPLNFIDSKWKKYNNIKNGGINLQKEEKIPEEFRSGLNEILKRNPNQRSEGQISTIKIIKNLYNGREKFIKFYNYLLEWHLRLNANQR